MIVKYPITHKDCAEYINEALEEIKSEHPSWSLRSYEYEGGYIKAPATTHGKKRVKLILQEARMLQNAAQGVKTYPGYVPSPNGQMERFLGPEDGYSDPVSESLLDDYEITFDRDGVRYYCLIRAKNMDAALGIFFISHPDINYRSIRDHTVV